MSLSLSRAKTNLETDSIVDKVLHSDKNLRIKNHLKTLIDTAGLSKSDQKTGLSPPTKTIFSTNGIKDQI